MNIYEPGDGNQPLKSRLENNLGLYEMLYQMERVIITARKYPDLMDTSPMSGRNAVAGKLAHEIHLLQQMPLYQQFSRETNLWQTIWEAV